MAAGKPKTPKISRATQAALDRLLDEGRELHAQGKNAGAIKAYARAAELAPQSPVPHYNMGFVWKYARRWERSLAANLKAIELGSESPAAVWNAAIAATALGDWKRARALWKRYGIELPGRSGDPAGDLGSVVIRINPEGRGETVWARRIDPARAILSSIPLPDSGYRFGDLVLHDGAPEGYRESHGRQVPVFNALQRLERSAYRTYCAEVVADTAEDIEALAALGEDLRVFAEDWTSMRTLCLRCSYGVPHRHRKAKREPAPSDDWSIERSIGIASQDIRQARDLLKRWASNAGRTVRRLYAGRPAPATSKPRAQWWNSETFIDESQSAAEEMH